MSMASEVSKEISEGETDNTEDWVVVDEDVTVFFNFIALVEPFLRDLDRSPRRPVMGNFRVTQRGVRRVGSLLGRCFKANSRCDSQEYGRVKFTGCLFTLTVVFRRVLLKFQW